MPVSFLGEDEGSFDWYNFPEMCLICCISLVRIDMQSALVDCDRESYQYDSLSCSYVLCAYSRGRMLEKLVCPEP